MEINNLLKSIRLKGQLHLLNLVLNWNLNMQKVTHQRCMQAKQNVLQLLNKMLNSPRDAPLMSNCKLSKMTRKMSMSRSIQKRKIKKLKPNKKMKKLKLLKSQALVRSCSAVPSTFQSDCSILRMILASRRRLACSIIPCRLLEMRVSGPPRLAFTTKTNLKKDLRPLE